MFSSEILDTNNISDSEYQLNGTTRIIGLILIVVGIFFVSLIAGEAKERRLKLHKNI